MKNKTKKILAGVALGCVGALTLTGCTGMDISQEQMDKVFTVIDNADNFMANTSENLDEKLSKEDAFMQEILDLLKEQNKKLEKDEAYGLLKFAMNKATLNIDGYMDNLKVTMVSSYGEIITVNCLKYDDSHNAILYTNKDWGENFHINYETTIKSGEYDILANRNYYSSEFMAGMPVKDTEPVLTTTASNEEGYNILQPYEVMTIFTFVDSLNINAEDICLVETLDNGNYALHITKSIEDGENNLLKFNVRVELTQNGDCVSIVSKSSSFNKNYGDRVDEINTFNYIFEKDAVDVEDVVSKIAIVEDFVKTQASSAE